MTQLGDSVLNTLVLEHNLSVHYKACCPRNSMIIRAVGKGCEIILIERFIFIVMIHKRWIGGTSFSHEKRHKKEEK